MASTSRRTSTLRKLSIYGFQAVEGGHCFHALLEFDITGLRKALREARIGGRGGSLFAFFIKAIAVCLREFPAFNSMGGSRRTTSFDEVDVSVPVEMQSGGEIYNKQLVIRGADRKGVAEIGSEIEASRMVDDGDKSYLPSPAMRALLAALPAFAARLAIRAVMSSHRMVKASSGTVFITSVSMFSSVPGFILPYAGGPKASSFAIGSVVKKPAAFRGGIALREIICVTASFNHDLVDGAPAARFINRLRELVESRFVELLS
jgi:pyruvate/2-oxoglutarate dehydrogenase complex dihydrolipoamide acyltransferase (E2) component